SGSLTEHSAAGSCHVLTYAAGSTSYRCAVNRRPNPAVLGLLAALLMLSACQAGHSTDVPRRVTTGPALSSGSTTSARPPSARPRAPIHSSRKTHPRGSANAASATPRRAPVIVIDPGHSVPIHATDPVTGLDVSDYANEPEMHDVFAVAELVRARLL